MTEIKKFYVLCVTEQWTEFGIQHQPTSKQVDFIQRGTDDKRRHTTNPQGIYYKRAI